MANELSLLKVVEPDTHDYRREIQNLEDENRSLRRNLDDAEANIQRLERTIENLRKTLNPIHRALRALFGEIELAVGEEDNIAVAPGVGPSMSVDPRWEHFKKQFPGVPATIIDALLIQGTMKMTNLAKLIGSHYETTRKATYKLRDAGAVTLTGGSVSLKR